MNFRQRYGAALHSRQSYGFSIQNRGAGGWVANQQIATTLTARIWVQDGNIMGFVAWWLVVVMRLET